MVIQPLTDELAQSFNINQEGILIAQVSENSPAEKAGLEQGDVIVAFAGKKVTNVGNFRNQVSLTEPGSQTKITILRNGKRKTLKVKIGKQDINTQVASGPAQSSDEIGLTIQTISPQLAEQYNIKPKEGVVVTQVKPGSIAAMAGIEPGTVILQVNQKTVNNATDFKREIKKK